MLIVPGGFSYGDDLGAGVLWALDLRNRLGDELDAFVNSGRPVLGICNGFQVLVKAGLLALGDEHLLNGHQADAKAGRRVTLTFNERRHFECRWVMLEPEPDSASLFTRGMTEPIYCPVAHGEGRFLARDDATLRALEASRMIAFRYAGSAYPENPNGSVAGIAAICNAQGNVMGLMPHPENHIFDWQHPRWLRGERGFGGLKLFETALRNS